MATRMCILVAVLGLALFAVKAEGSTVDELEGLGGKETVQSPLRQRRLPFSI